MVVDDDHVDHVPRFVTVVDNENVVIEDMQFEMVPIAERGSDEPFSREFAYGLANGTDGSSEPFPRVCV